MKVYVLTHADNHDGCVDNGVFVFAKESSARREWERARENALYFDREFLDYDENNMYFRTDSNYECFVREHEVLPY